MTAAGAGGVSERRGVAGAETSAAPRPAEGNGARPAFAACDDPGVGGGVWGFCGAGGSVDINACEVLRLPNTCPPVDYFCRCKSFRSNGDSSPFFDFLASLRPVRTCASVRKISAVRLPAET